MNIDFQIPVTLLYAGGIPLVAFAYLLVGAVVTGVAGRVDWSIGDALRNGEPVIAAFISFWPFVLLALLCCGIACGVAGIACGVARVLSPLATRVALGKLPR